MKRATRRNIEKTRRQQRAKEQDDARKKKAVGKAVRDVARAQDAGDPYEQARIVQTMSRELKAAGLDVAKVVKCMQALAKAAQAWEQGIKLLDALEKDLKRSKGR